MTCAAFTLNRLQRCRAKRAPFRTPHGMACAMHFQHGFPGYCEAVLTDVKGGRHGKRCGALGRLRDDKRAVCGRHLQWQIFYDEPGFSQTQLERAARVLAG